MAIIYTISVPAARDFTESFYQSLRQKDSLAIAMSSGKSAIGIEGKEWYRLVLYLRWEDNDGGKLFKYSVASSNYPIQTSPTFPVTPTKNLSLSQTMKLNNEQQEKLQEALISAFPNKPDLERLLQYELEIQLNTIADGGNYTEIVFNLLNHLKSQGRTQYLIQAAYKVNPGNPELQEFMRQINIENGKNPISKNNFHKKMSRARQLQIENLEQDRTKLEKDYVAVAEKKRRESNPQEQHNLQLQLDNISRQIDEIELQLNRLEDGDE
ncbi:MAG: effector-associated domain EAD1-containing protein [Scytonema sp. PMC 1069.18]|nr:effector-associated domain EAD1-containing protein [Scytonema sp. PMC 1069.18]MEC4885115.1 effector-associated domain EAD1-containing protein [Scytonema sp. PMC 1070.18]